MNRDFCPFFKINVENQDGSQKMLIGVAAIPVFKGMGAGAVDAEAMFFIKGDRTLIFADNLQLDHLQTHLSGPCNDGRQKKGADSQAPVLFPDGYAEGRAVAVPFPLGDRA